MQIPQPTLKTRLEEVNDLVKTAKWKATGGYELWKQFEGKNLSLKEQNVERDARLEAYVKLRIEQAKLIEHN